MYSVIYAQNYIFLTMIKRLDTNDFDLAMATYNNNYSAQFWYMGKLILEK